MRKKLGQGTLTGGLRHMQSYTDNRYEGEDVMNVLLKQAESYAYTEYKGKIQNWGYIANLSLNRFYYSQRE